MGYESKFHIVQGHDFEDGKGAFFAERIAMFDMSKLGHDSHTFALVQRSPVTTYYIYADDGDTKITQDCYGEALKEIEITDLLSALKKDDHLHGRMKPFIALLESFDASEWKNLKVLHFGY